MSHDNAARRIAQRAGSVAALAIMLVLAACATPPPPPLTAAETADVNRVTAYLNSIPRFAADFIQYGSFGEDAGRVWLDRPDGKMRIDYTGPEHRVMVISDGQVSILNRSNGAITTMPVSRTPLGVLLTPQIALSGQVTVTGVVQQPGMLQITVRKTDRPGQGNLTLTLADNPLRLIAVTVMDAEDRTLTMRLSRIDPDPVLTPAMFQPPT